jgi:flagellar protein FlbT
MPLRIKLPAKEKIIINGAVIENGGDATTIVLHNRADILRRKEVLKETEADTPAKRVYFALQSAYLFEDDREQLLRQAKGLLADYEEAAPSAKDIADEVRDNITTEQFYTALRTTQKLINHEEERLTLVND